MTWLATRIAGTTLVLAPFGVMTGLMLSSGGWVLAVGVWSIVAAVVACIWGGVALLMRD